MSARGRSFVVEADGGSRGNPGPAAYGAVVKDAVSGAVLAEVGAPIGVATNNVAEYSGLVAGLQAVRDLDPQARVEVRMDSKLVVEQMSGRWQIKHEDMRRLARQARDVLPATNVRYTWVPRAQNGHADRLVNEALDGPRRRAAGAAAGVHVSGTGVPDGETTPPRAGRDRQAPPVTAPDDTANGPVVPSPADGYAGDLTPAQSLALLRERPDAVLVDCRTEPEWGYVGVPDLSGIGKEPVLVQWQRYPDGTVNPDFVAQVRGAGVDQGTPVVFLCRSGARSVAAARAATAAGLGPAYNVLDGFEGGLDEQGHRGSTGWRAAGLPWRQS